MKKEWSAIPPVLLGLVTESLSLNETTSLVELVCTHWRNCRKRFVGVLRVSIQQLRHVLLRSRFLPSSLRSLQLGRKPGQKNKISFGASLNLLKRCPALDALSICFQGVQDTAGWEQLGKLTNLRIVGLDFAWKIQHKTVVILGPLTYLLRLEELSLHRVEVSKRAVSVMSGLRQLQRLRLESCEVQTGFSELRGLRSLQLVDCGVNNPTKFLRACAQLEHLTNLQNTRESFDEAWFSFTHKPRAHGSRPPLTTLRTTILPALSLAEFVALQTLTLTWPVATEHIVAISRLPELRDLQLVAKSCHSLGWILLNQVPCLARFELRLYHRIGDLSLLEEVHSLRHLTLPFFLCDQRHWAQLARLTQLQSMRCTHGVLINKGFDPLKPPCPCAQEHVSWFAPGTTSTTRLSEKRPSEKKELTKSSCEDRNAFPGPRLMLFLLLAGLFVLLRR
jgi:hypothetical protein